jgi:hypothetical protein
LSTGQVINQAYATRLPMPDDIIERVNMMAQQQKANPGMIFLNRHNELVDQIDLMDNISYGDDEDEGGSDDNIDNQVHDEIMNEIEDDIEHDEVEIAGVGDDNGVGAEEENQEDNDIEAPADDEDEMILEQDDEDAMIPREEVNANDEHDTMEPDDGINEQEDEQQQIAAQMDDRYGQRTSHYDLRPRKPRDYSHLFAEMGDPLSTPQMNMKQGLQFFGEEGVDAVRKEMRQIHDRKVTMAKASTDLTYKQCEEVLAYLMFFEA